MYNLQGIIRKNINNASSMFERLGYVGTNFAKAGILEIDGEKVEYVPINITYDVEKVKEEIKKLNYSFHESVLRIFYE